MKRIVSLVLAVTLLLSVAALGVRASPPGRPFTGVWESIDPGDGSQQQLVITPVGGASAAYRVVTFDHGASACGWDPLGHVMIAAIGTGTGWADGNILYTQSAIWCLGRPRSFWGTWSSQSSYDATTDTLTDSWDGWTTIWHRQGGR